MVLQLIYLHYQYLVLLILEQMLQPHLLRLTTALDNGAITVVFNAVETQSVNSPDAYWSGVSFKVHTSIGAITNSNPTIELRNS